MDLILSIDFNFKIKMWSLELSMICSDWEIKKKGSYLGLFLKEFKRLSL